MSIDCKCMHGHYCRIITTSSSKLNRREYFSRSSDTFIHVRHASGTASSVPMGRRVWFQYHDTQLTFEKSYLARLKYVNENPVHHGIVLRATNYGWCSARWFEDHAERAF